MLKSHKWCQGWLGVVGGKHAPDIFAIFHDIIGGEMCCAEGANVTERTSDFDLTRDFAGWPILIDHFVQSSAGKDELVARVLFTPPFE